MERDLEHLADVFNLLNSVAGRILQVSDRKASVALGAGTKVLVGSTLATSIMGLVGSLGTASTGTAIASLSGAAKTTASLYWIGGLIGGGVAAGTVVLGAGAIGAGVYGSLKVRRAILGHARQPETISEREQRILQASHALAMALRQVIDDQNDLSPRELTLFSKIGLSPLLAEIEEALTDGSFESLKFYNRARLRGHVNNLTTLQKKLEQT